MSRTSLTSPTSSSTRLYDPISSRYSRVPSYKYATSSYTSNKATKTSTSRYGSDFSSPGSYSRTYNLPVTNVTAKESRPLPIPSATRTNVSSIANKLENTHISVKSNDYLTKSNSRTPLRKETLSYDQNRSTFPRSTYETNKSTYQRTTASYSPAHITDSSTSSPTASRTVVSKRTYDTQENRQRKGLVGLRNLGNTCYMNSILQCLSNTKPLCEWCLSNSWKDEINDNSTSNGLFVTAFVNLMKQMWTADESYVSPTEFKSHLSRLAPRFRGYNQQDSQEALRYILEGLHNDINRVQTKPRLPVLDDDKEIDTPADTLAAEAWRRYLQRDNSKITDVFVGQLKSSLKCMKCGYTSHTFDPFWDLSLSLPRGRCTLRECFTMFTNEETLDGDERPTCARCKERRKCTKSFLIQKFPDVLVIHLKRFDDRAYYRSKLNTLVEFPLDKLDLTAFASNQNCVRGSYVLRAVCNHSGSASYGHYVAACRHPYSSEWHMYNDNRVTSVSSSSLTSPEAYVLFYELRSSCD